MSRAVAVQLSREEMAAICEERTEEGNLAIAQLTYAQVRSLARGHVPKAVMYTAKLLLDNRLYDLRKNACKPLRPARRR